MIREFRRRHLADFQQLFVSVVRMAAESGLVKLGSVAVDGRKVKVNASKRKVMWCQRMKWEEARPGPRLCLVRVGPLGPNVVPYGNFFI